MQQTESLIASLEGAEEALLFGSGMAAATSVFLALDKPTHVIASKVMYWGFRSWLREIGRYGHRVSFIETSDLKAVRDAILPGETGLFWIETPSNPLWTVTDISAVAEIAHGCGAVLCVDFDCRHSDIDPPAIAGRRHRHALSDEISERTLRRCRRLFSHCSRGPVVGQNSKDPRATR